MLQRSSCERKDLQEAPGRNRAHIFLVCSTKSGPLQCSSYNTNTSRKRKSLHFHRMSWTFQINWPIVPNVKRCFCSVNVVVTSLRLKTSLQLKVHHQCENLHPQHNVFPGKMTLTIWRLRTDAFWLSGFDTGMLISTKRPRAIYLCTPWTFPDTFLSRVLFPPPPQEPSNPCEWMGTRGAPFSMNIALYEIYIKMPISTISSKTKVINLYTTCCANTPQFFTLYSSQT